MTGERKNTDLSTRLGVKRAKPSLSKLTRTSPSITSPPKAAIATAKQKKEEEVQRNRNPFNDMLHHRTSKDKDRHKDSVSKTAPVNGEGVHADDAEAVHGRDEDGVGGELTVDKSAGNRVAELERALAVAREEQNAMREELAKLKEHGSVYRETIEDYRRQLAGTYTHSPPGAFHTHSRPTSSGSATIPMDYENEISPRRSLNNSRREDLEQNHDFRSRVAQLQDQLINQESHFQSKVDQMRSRNEVDWNELTVRLHTAEKISQERLQQLLSLKSSISSLTRIDAQITDSELTETLAQLANRVREWVISNFRRAKLDMSSVPPGTAKALEAISPSYNEIDALNRLQLYQALISNSMMHFFREPIVVGLPQTGPLSSIRQAAAYIHEAGDSYREWRRTTSQSLQKGYAQQILQEERERLTHRLSGEIGHQLFTLTSMNLTPAAQTTLEGILHTAADLQNTLLLQKAEYRVVFFRRQEDEEIGFDDHKMETINDLDTSMDDVGIERKFSFCVFPCLEKFGDEYGEHANVRNVLLKASVCCDVG